MLSTAFITLPKMRRIYCRQYRDWSLVRQEDLRCHNFGAEGYMRQTLDHNPVTYVMLDSGELIGWALVASEHDFEFCYGPGFAMFYVRKRYRRQGVGSELAARIKEDYDDLSVAANDKQSIEFFNAVKLLKYAEEVYE